MPFNYEDAAVQKHLHLQPYESLVFYSVDYSTR